MAGTKESKAPRLRVKNWDQFQHYRDRSPPWIKLHRSVLDDLDFCRLPVVSKALAPMLWLLASESDDGSVTGDTDELAFRLRMKARDVEAALKPLIDREFLIGDGTVLACDKRGATPEVEAEKRTEGGQQAGLSRFDEFWDAYPRKEKKVKARQTWKTKRLDKLADQIIADVRARIDNFKQWRDRDFIPLPTTYLNAEQWNDEWDGRDKPNDPWRAAVALAKQLGLDRFRGAPRETPAQFMARVRAASEGKK